jgi:hypothetical protein
VVGVQLQLTGLSMLVRYAFVGIVQEQCLIIDFMYDLVLLCLCKSMYGVFLCYHNCSYKRCFERHCANLYLSFGLLHIFIPSLTN